MLSSTYLAHTPYPLPTKDGGVLRTVGDAHAYILALPKTRERCAHWQHAWRLLLRQASAAALTRPSPRAVHGWQAERWCIRAHEQCSAMATTCPYVAARATGT